MKNYTGYLPPSYQGQATQLTVYAELAQAKTDLHQSRQENVRLVKAIGQEQLANKVNAAMITNLCDKIDNLLARRECARLVHSEQRAEIEEKNDQYEALDSVVSTLQEEVQCKENKIDWLEDEVEQVRKYWHSSDNVAKQEIQDLKKQVEIAKQNSMSAQDIQIRVIKEQRAKIDALEKEAGKSLKGHYKEYDFCLKCENEYDGKIEDLESQHVIDVGEIEELEALVKDSRDARDYYRKAWLDGVVLDV